jgi:hypothetical protein
MGLQKVVWIGEKINKWAARHMSKKRQADIKISAATKNGFWKIPPDVRKVAGFNNDAVWYYDFLWLK